MKGVIILFMLSLNYGSDGSRLSRCELVYELRSLKFDENSLRDWVCLVESARLRHMDLARRKHRDGFWHHGLFHINDRRWCSNTNNPGKECNVTCEQLYSSSIMYAADCAKNIYYSEGFGVWSTWRRYCDGKQLPDISACNNPIEN